MSRLIRSAQEIYSLNFNTLSAYPIMSLYSISAVLRPIDFRNFMNAVVFSYMQIGEILTKPDYISKYSWHPHSAYQRLNNANNALYIPTEKLSIVPSRKGYGTLDYRKDRVLTMEGKGRATWNELDFLKPEHVYGKRKTLLKAMACIIAVNRCSLSSMNSVSQCSMRG